MTHWVVTYAEHRGGTVYKYGPVSCNDPSSAVDALSAAYLAVGLTSPQYIYQITEVTI